MILGVLIGGLAGPFVASLLPYSPWVRELAWALFAALGALFGIMAGNARANALRLQAQIALCQVQIERNTRRLA